MPWTMRSFLYGDYHDCELGYAVTDHVARATVEHGLTLITGTEDRQHAYVALTRGSQANTAFVFTLSPKIADPAPGPRPAPELAREHRYLDLLTAALPAGHPDELSPKARWLWRTLRAAELAGLDAGQVLAEAVGQRSLHDAQDVAAVIDSRVRRRTAALARTRQPGCVHGVW